MEAKLLPQSRIPLATPALRRRQNKPRWSPVLAVLVRQRENLAGITGSPNVKPAETSFGITEKTTVYKDNWFDRLAIDHLSKNLQATTGMISVKSGYESLVDAAAMAARMFDPIQQRQLVVEALQRAIPAFILTMIRALLPQSQFTREYFAFFTTMFFAWLIGPSEVRESELNGKREKNVVHVRKCRFLEQSNCVGMCINLCKMPSQTFIKDSLGMPVSFVPNFEDMSCEMIFGQEPHAPMDDPALKQPCYKLCKATRKHSIECSS